MLCLASISQLYGPIWTEPIHDFDFVKSLLGQVSSSPDQLKMSERIRGFLTVISEVHACNGPFAVITNYDIIGGNLGTKSTTDSETQFLSAWKLREDLVKSSKHEVDSPHFSPNHIIICNCKLFIAEEIIAPSLDNKSIHISDLLLGKAMCIIGGGGD